MNSEFGKLCYWHKMEVESKGALPEDHMSRFVSRKKMQNERIDDRIVPTHKPMHQES
jgi:hypothetical protein